MSRQEHYIDQLLEQIANLKAAVDALADNGQQLVFKLEAQNKELTKALKSTIPILEYFDRGLDDVSEGSGEEQPMHKEIKLSLTKAEQALRTT